MIKISVNLDAPVFAGQNPKKIRLVLAPICTEFFLPIAHPKIATTFNQIGETGRSVPIWLEVGGSTPIYIENSDFLFLGDGKDPFMGMRHKSTLIDFMRKNLIIIEKDGVALTPEQVTTYSL